MTFGRYFFYLSVYLFFLFCFFGGGAKGLVDHTINWKVALLPHLEQSGKAEILALCSCNRLAVQAKYHSERY